MRLALDATERLHRAWLAGNGVILSDVQSFPRLTGESAVLQYPAIRTRLAGLLGVANKSLTTTELLKLALKQAGKF